ncbi:MAG: DUF1543 domain-containing protein [Niabella sp.]|nr:DUF1543 domain-containing protein [Niabella sp.]
MEEYKLFYLLLGCTPRGRHTEQHDVFFCIGKNLPELVPHINAFWPEAAGNIHIDAWREVNVVNGYKIIVQERGGQAAKAVQLFFINLGGYQPGVFEEYHYKLLAAANDLGNAIQQAKQTSFYKDYNAAAQAASHVDNKYGVDVDEVFTVEDILPAAQKKQFAITLQQEEQLKEDTLHIGYLKLSKLEV